MALAVIQIFIEVGIVSVAIWALFKNVFSPKGAPKNSPKMGLPGGQNLS